MEAISYFFDIENYFTQFMDLVNASQGILVFIFIGLTATKWNCRVQNNKDGEVGSKAVAKTDSSKTASTTCWKTVELFENAHVYDIIAKHFVFLINYLINLK